LDLQNRAALVTGSAHRVGKAIALALARRGADILIHYGRSEDEAEQTRREIEALGVRASIFPANLAEPDQIATLFEAARERFGRLDVLVNSAASFQKQAFDKITPESWERSMRVNLRAPFLCSQQAARLMGESEREAPALIVNIVDLSGVYPWNGYVQHGVSKAGLRHLTKVSARALAPAIRVNALVLGPILPPGGMDPQGEAWQKIERGVPLKRSADPDEVGQAVVSLAENDFITGAELFVDGGEGLLGAFHH
jgi:NAD(P)-dependent dehydrogenase (short-subunit alcohol dehydrogenase family)